MGNMVRRAWFISLGLALGLALGGCVLPGGGTSGGAGATAAEAGPGDPRPKPRPGSSTVSDGQQARASAATVAQPAGTSPALEPPAPSRTPDADDDMLPQAAEAEAAQEEAGPAPELPKELFTPAAPAPVPAALTGQAEQCTKQKGRFVQRGEGGTYTCVTPTRDANKRCDDSSDCDGICFAKSRTCAPVTPLFGCYDALENGRVVNICTE